MLLVDVFKESGKNIDVLFIIILFYLLLIGFLVVMYYYYYKEEKLFCVYLFIKLVIKLVNN